MARKDKNGNSLLSDFRKYRKDEMSSKERHELEKRLQRDLFEDEASEGLSDLSEEELKDDLKSLNNRLDTRLRIRRFPVFYRYAAAVIVLLIISSLLLVREIHRPEYLLSENVKAENDQSGQTKGKEAGNEPLMQGYEKAEEAEKASKTEETAINDKKEVIRQVSIVEDHEDTTATEGIAVAGIVEPEQDVAVTESDLLTTRAAKPVVALPAVDISESKDIYPDSSFVMLDEAAATGYDTESKAMAGKAGVTTLSEKNAGIPEDREPVPEGGMDRLDEYIRENAAFPDGYSGTGREVVRLWAVINPDGSVSGINILRSPGTFFSDMSERLLKNGPVWQPAISNGIPVKDSVNLRIIYRK